MTNATTFGKQAAVYAKGRPGYPTELFDWIARKSAGQDAVWDVGAGSGQAAHALAKHYSHVHATDISEDQIKAAAPHPNISYSVAAASVSGLSDESVDAITSATAVHWFADTAFWSEVRRVAKPGALFCAWTYQLPRGEPSVQSRFLVPVLDLIDPYWAQGNRICMEGYSAENLKCPYRQLETPDFEAGGLWTPLALADFVESWSAHFRAREAGLAEPLAELRAQFLADFKGQALNMTLPLSILAVDPNT